MSDLERAILRTLRPHDGAYLARLLPGPPAAKGHALAALVRRGLVTRTVQPGQSPHRPLYLYRLTVAGHAELRGWAA